MQSSEASSPTQTHVHSGAAESAVPERGRGRRDHERRSPTESSRARRTGTARVAPTVCVAVSFAVLAGLIYAPLARVFGRMGELEGVLDLLGESYYRRVAAFSLYQAFMSTVAAMILGVPGAYLVARYRFPGRNVLRAAATVPFILPSVLVVLGFVLFWGNNGWVNRVLGFVAGTDDPVLRVLYSLRGIILAHAFYNFPIFLRIVGARWESLGVDQALAARSLGASRLRAFATITAPKLAPALAAAASLVFLFCFTSFAVILVLGGGPATTTLEVEVYRLARMNVDLGRASQVALIQTVLSAGVIVLYLSSQGSPITVFGERSAAGSGARGFRGPSKARGARVVLAAAYATALLLVVVGPIVAVVTRSVLEPTSWAGRPRFTVRWFADLFAGGESARAIGNSVVVGLGAAGIATTLGALYAWGVANLPRRIRGVLELVAVLPLGISPVVLGLGYFYINRSAEGLPDLLLLAIVHSMLGFPFVVRTLISGFSSVPKSLSWAARSLGASRLDGVVSVEMPLVRGAVAAAASFAFALSMGEINAAIMLTSGTVATIPVVMYRLLAAYRFTAACALGTILMLLALLVFLGFEGRRRTA